MLVEHLHESRTRTQIEHLLFQHELDTRFSGPNILSSLGNVFDPLVREDAHESEMVRAIGLIEEIAKSLLESAYPTEEDWVGSGRSERDQEIYRQFAARPLGLTTWALLKGGSYRLSLTRLILRKSVACWNHVCNCTSSSSPQLT